MALSIFWFRRDLRLEDNAGLCHALKNGLPVVPVFIFDRHILDGLEDRADPRVEFIHAALEEIQVQLVRLGSSLEVYYDHPLNVFRHLLSRYPVTRVFTNEDYEPYAHTIVFSATPKYSRRMSEGRNVQGRIRIFLAGSFHVISCFVQGIWII